MNKLLTMATSSETKKKKRGIKHSVDVEKIIQRKKIQLTDDEKKIILKKKKPENEDKKS